MDNQQFTQDENQIPSEDLQSLDDSWAWAITEELRQLSAQSTAHSEEEFADYVNSFPKE